MSATIILTGIIISISTLFGAVVLLKLGVEMQHFRLRETPDTLLFKFLNLRYFAVLYVVMFGSYAVTLWIFLVAFKL